jgi:hypothetical protein
LYALATTRTTLAALAYQPCLSVAHTGTVALHAAASICVPADPLAVSSRYPVDADAIAVQLDAFGVVSPTDLKNAPAISTPEPEAMRLAALVVKSVRLIPQYPISPELMIVTLVAICENAIYRSSSISMDQPNLIRSSWSNDISPFMLT